MYIANRDFLYILRHPDLYEDVNEQLLSLEFDYILRELKSEYSALLRKNLPAACADTHTGIVWMLYVVNIKPNFRKDSETQKFQNSKLFQGYSMDNFIYKYIIENFDLFEETIPESTFKEQFIYPQELLCVPDYIDLTQDRWNYIDLTSPVQEVSSVTPSETVNTPPSAPAPKPLSSPTMQLLSSLSNIIDDAVESEDSYAKCIILSRHSLHDLERGMIEETLGTRVKFYQHTRRIRDMQCVVNDALGRGIRIFVAILSDAALHDLVQKVHGRALILRPKYGTPAHDIEILNADWEGYEEYEEYDATPKTYKGFEVVRGFKCLTADFTEESYSVFSD